MHFIFYLRKTALFTLLSDKVRPYVYRLFQGLNWKCSVPVWGPQLIAWDLRMLSMELETDFWEDKDHHISNISPGIFWKPETPEAPLDIKGIQFLSIQLLMINNKSILISTLKLH